MPMNLGVLTLQRRMFDYTTHVRPKESSCDELRRGSYARMRQGMKSLKKGRFMTILNVQSMWAGIAKNFSFGRRKR